MKKGSSNFLIWLVSSACLAGMIFLLFFHPDHYRKQGKEQSDENYRLLVEELRTDEANAANELKAMTAQRDKLKGELNAAIVLRDSAVERQNRAYQKGRDIDAKNMSLIKTNDSLNLANDSLILENASKSKGLADSLVVLQSTRKGKDLLTIRLSNQSKLIHELEEKIECDTWQVTRATEIEKAHYSYRFLFYGLLLIFGIVLYAVSRGWLFFGSKQKRNVSSSAPSEKLNEGTVRRLPHTKMAKARLRIKAFFML